MRKNILAIIIFIIMASVGLYLLEVPLSKNILEWMKHVVGLILIVLASDLANNIRR